MNRVLQKTIFLGIVLYICLGHVLFAQQFVPDASFNPSGAGAAGSVLKHHVLPSGKILIAGSFQSYNGVAKRGIARLNADGTIDATFSQGGTGASANSTVNDFVVQPDGKIIIVGTFSTYSPASGQNPSKNKVTRMDADGNTLDAFNVAFASVVSVNGVALQSNGKIILIGDFWVTINGNNVQGIVRLNADGSIDNTFTPPTNGFNTPNLNTIAVDASDRIYVGGFFTSYGSTTVSCFARLTSNGVLDTSYSPASTQANSTVRVVRLQSDGKAVIGGDFTSYRQGSGTSVLRNGIARLNLDGSVDTGFQNGFSGVTGGAVLGMTIQSDNRILICGSFSHVNGSSATRVFRLTSTGANDNTSSWGSGANFPVNSISDDGTKIFIGGSMSTFNGGSMPSGFGRLLVKQAQTITFTTLPAATPTNRVYGSAPITLDGASSSGLPVTYTTSPAVQSVVSISGNTLTIIGTGSVIITATQIGDASYNAASSTGRTFVVNPKPISIIGLTVSDKEYDASIAATASGGTLQGVLDGDAVTISPGVANFDSKNVGTGKTVTFGGYSLSGANATRYSLLSQPVSTTASITKASVSMFVDAANANRMYNGTTGVSLSSIYLTGVKGSDIVNLISGTYAFGDKHVENNKPVVFTGYGISGIDAVNYNFVLPTVTANVTPLQINIGGVTVSNKSYDGTTAATITNNGVLVGVLPGDAVAVGNISGVFSNKAIGTRSVTLTFTLSGSDAGNYTVFPPSVSATITSKDISVTGITANNKEYNGDQAATLSGSPVLSGVIPGDAVSLNGNTPNAQFSDRHVGTGKTVNVYNYGLTGADYINYNLLGVTLTANITKKEITVGGITVQSKAYDGTTSATFSGATLVGKYPIDNVSLTNGTGTFADKNAGDNKVVTFSGFSISGVDANNYTLAPVSNKTASITPLSRSILYISVSGKIYDGTTVATISNAGTVSGLLAGDNASVDISEAVARFGAATATSSQSVQITGLKLAGPDAANYSISSTINTNATIAPKPITVQGIVVNNKVYDGGLYTSVSTIGTLSGVIAGDNIVLNAPSPTAQFADKNVGTGKSVTLNGYWLTGSVTNYTLVTPTATANITPKELTVLGLTINSKAYDGTTSASYSGGFLSGAVGGDNFTLTPGTCAFSNKNAGDNKTVTFTGMGFTGAGSGNYFLTQPTGTASISQKSLFVLNAAVADKTYDGSPIATLQTVGNLDGKINGDNVTLLAPASVAFQSKTVGNNKAVNSSGYNLSGVDAPNYTLIQPSLIASIVKKQLTVTGVIVSNKQYDGNTATTLTHPGDLQGIISPDQVTVTGDNTVHFNTKDVGNAKPVTLTNYVLHNADAGNYSVLIPSATADITPKILGIQNLTPLDKTYNGTDDLTHAGGTLAGVAPGEVVSATFSGKFNNKNVGVSKPVIFTGQLAGPDAANYALPSINGYVASIFQRVVTLDNVVVADKTYDGTATATLVGTPVLTNKISGDDLTLSTTPSSFMFTTVNADNGIQIAINGLSLSGSDASNYSLGTLPTLTGNILKATAVINNFADIVKAIGDPQFILTATTNSNAPIGYNIVGGDNILTLNNNSVTLTGNTGTATLRASVISNTNFTAASKDITVTVSALPAPVITFANLSKVYTDPAFMVAATSTSPGAISYSLVSGSAVVSPTGQVTITGAGEIQVQATQAGTANFSGATKIATITVSKAALTVRAEDKTKTFGNVNPAFTLSYTGFKTGDNASNSGITLPGISTSATTESSIGTYSIVLSGGDGGSNYNMMLQNGELTITKGMATIALSDLTSTYNGASQAVTVTTTPAGLTTNVVYKQNGVDIGSPVNAGVYQVEASITDANFENVQTSGSFTVEQADAVISLSNLETTYDGTLKSVTVTTQPAGLSTLISYSQNDVEVDEVVNAGEYDVTVLLNELNYKSPGSENVLTVNKANAVVTLSGLTTTYDGTVKSVGVTTMPVGLDYQAVYRQNGEVVEPLNAGTYDVQVNVVDNPNYNGTPTTNVLTINKVTATISVTDLVSTFDGSEKHATITTIPSNVGIAHQYLQNGNPVAAYTAGAYDLHVSIDDINYEGQPVTETFVINKGQIAINFINAEKTYDGTAKFLNVSTSPADLESLVTIQYKQNDVIVAEPINAGEYTVEALVADLNWEGSATGVFTIVKANATATISNLTTTYDGTVKAVSVETTPSALNHTLVYKQNGVEISNPVNAGAYEVEVVVDDANYRSEIISATLTINKAQATATVSNVVETFDGNAKSVTVTTVPEGLATVITFKKEGGDVNEAINAGTYQVAAYVNDLNYESEVATGTVTINKATATISAENVTSVFDGIEKPITVITTPAGLDVAVVYTQNGIEMGVPVNVGVYQAEASIADPNYETTTANATVTITKVQATISVSNLNVSYDGNAKAVVVATTPEGLSTNVVYKQNGVVVASPVNAGVYNVEASVNDSNAEPANITATLTINKAVPVITLNALITTYDGAVKFSEVTVEPSAVNTQVVYKQDGIVVPEPINAGEYQIEVTVVDDNSEYASKSDVFTINKAEATVTLTSANVVYDASAKQLIATTVPQDLPFEIIYRKDGVVVNEPIGAGTYNVEAVITNANYLSNVAEGTLTIEKASALIQLDGLTTTYDGTSKTAVVSTVPQGLSTQIVYKQNGNAVGQTVNAGTYQLEVIVDDNNYVSDAAFADFTISKASAQIVLEDLTATYDGMVKSPILSTVPQGLLTQVVYTQNGNAVVEPVNAGTYGIEVVITDNNHVSDAAVSNFTIDKAQATILVDGLATTYDGTAKSAVVTTTPSGLDFNIIYKQGDQTVTSPVNAGDYVVEVSVNDDNYDGATVENMTIEKAEALVTLAGLTSVYDGNVKMPTITTTPAGLATTVSYARNGSAVANAINAGSYAVEVVVVDDNYFSESIQETLTINKATTTLVGQNATETYDGTAKSIEVTATPANTPVVMTYNGATALPINAGTYEVIATSEESENHTGATLALTLVINKGAQMISFTPIENKLNSAAAFDINAVSTSGLPVSIAITDGPAVINGSTVTLTGGLGSVIFRMTQSGNENYLPANDVVGTFNVEEDVVLNTEGPLEKLVSVYPIPAKDFITVAAGGLGIKSIRLYNASGSILTELNDLSGNESERVSVEHVTSGVILIEVTTVDKKRILKRGFILK